jgi:hypothetical protein
MSSKGNNADSLSEQISLNRPPTQCTEHAYIWAHHEHLWINVHHIIWAFRNRGNAEFLYQMVAVPVPWAQLQKLQNSLPKSEVSIRGTDSHYIPIRHFRASMHINPLVKNQQVPIKFKWGENRKRFVSSRILYSLTTKVYEYSHDIREEIFSCPLNHIIYKLRPFSYI